MWNASSPGAERRLILVLLAACALLAGCGGGPPAGTDPDRPPEADDAEGWARALPDARYVTAWGVSSASAREAELDAKAQVSAKVRSSLRAETTSIMRAVMRDDQVSDFQDLVSEITTTTRFSRAELIRIIDLTVHRDKEGNYRVLAALSRRELGEALQPEYDQRAADFRAAAAALTAAAAPSPGAVMDLPAVTAAWNRSRHAFALLVATAAETKAGVRLAPAGFNADQALWNDCAAARDQALDAASLVLVLEPGDGELDTREVAERLRAGLAELGVRAAGEACRPDAVELRFKPDLVWTRVIGRIVSLRLDGAVGPCGSEAWSEVVLEGAAMRGEGRDPLADLYDSMTAEAVAEVLRASLGHVLPL